MQNRVFFPQAALDQWMIDGTIDLSGTELTLLAEGRRYEVAEAVRVLKEVTTGEDPKNILGRVKSKAALEELGAELLETSMILGEHAYDVAPGWLGVPTGTFEKHLTSPERAAARAKDQGEKRGVPRSEEELLARLLL